MPHKSKNASQAPVSFAADILPLFRAVDIQHMAPMGVLLNNYTYMSTPDNAKTVYGYLAGTSSPRMPMGGPYWTPTQLALFQSWMSTGYNP